MLMKDKFTDERFTDAVDNVLRNCTYPQPTVAEFLSYDRKVKLHTYEEAVKITMEYGKPLTDVFEKKEVNGKVLWIKK